MIIKMTSFLKLHVSTFQEEEESADVEAMAGYTAVLGKKINECGYII